MLVVGLLATEVRVVDALVHAEPVVLELVIGADRQKPNDIKVYYLTSKCNLPHYAAAILCIIIIIVVVPAALLIWSPAFAGLLTITSIASRSVRGACTGVHLDCQIV